MENYKQNQDDEKISIDLPASGIKVTFDTPNEEHIERTLDQMLIDSGLPPKIYAVCDSCEGSSGGEIPFLKVKEGEESFANYIRSRINVRHEHSPAGVARVPRAGEETKH